MMRRLPSSALAILFVALHGSTTFAQSDTIAARTLAPGVTYRHVMEKAGPYDMHIVRIDLRRAELQLVHARAFDSLRGRERPSEMAKRAASKGLQVLAAINADFFELQSGENENNQVISGEWWKGVKNTDSPYDTWDNTHIQFAIDAARRPAMDRYLFDGRAIVRGVSTTLVSLNFNPSGKPEGTALYTSRFGAVTPRDTTRPTVEVAMMRVGARGDTVVFVRQGAVMKGSGSAIPAGGAVLSAYGTGLRASELSAMADGDTVRVVMATLPRIPHPSLVLGGWPRILNRGEDVTATAPIAEGTISRNAEMKHPRSAIGFSRDSNTVILFTVDGRSENSGGMTLHEVATHMKTLGAWNAMNFDGGGSTTMVIDGALVNKPSDATGERAVGNALLLVRRP
jgi:hypothetical protein